MIKSALLLVAAVSCATSHAFVVFPFGYTWKYDASGDLGNGWIATTFDDSGWLSGQGQFGFGDNDETTRVESDTTTQYYRKTVNMPETRGWASATLSVIHDDGAVVYVNGVEVGRANMPEGPVGYGTPSLDALSGAQESTPTVIAVPDNLWVFGDNVIAISVHNFRAASTDMSFDCQLDASAAPSPSPPPPTTTSEEVVARGATWKFLDTGTDVSGSAWTTMVYNDGAWGSGPGPFGYGDSVTTEVARNGITVFFRTTFVVQFVDQVQSGTVAVRRDDGIVCYINGAEVVRDNMPAGDITGETLAKQGIGGADETRYYGGFTFDKTILQAGNNLLACSVHQQSAASSDLSFDGQVFLELLIDFDAPTPSPSPAPSPAGQPSKAPSPAASKAPSATPSRSPTPTSSLPAGVTPSNTPSPTASLPAGITPSNTPAPSASPTSNSGGSNACTVCSCACLSACPNGDPIIAACNNANSSGGSSNTGIIVGSVVFVAAAVAALGAFVWYRKKSLADSKKGKGKAPNLALTDIADVEAGEGKHHKKHHHKKHHKDRKDRKDRDKDKDKDKDRRSKSRHRKDGEDGDKKHHRSKSRHDKKEKKERKERKEKKDDRHRSKSRGKDEERKSRSSKRSASPTSKSKSRKSKSPNKSGSSPRH